jgi:hypothetical protein
LQLPPSNKVSRETGGLGGLGD